MLYVSPYKSVKMFSTGARRQLWIKRGGCLLDQSLCKHSKSKSPSERHMQLSFHLNKSCAKLCEGGAWDVVGLLCHSTWEVLESIFAMHLYKDVCL